MAACGWNADAVFQGSQGIWYPAVTPVGWSPAQDWMEERCLSFWSSLLIVFVDPGFSSLSWMCVLPWGRCFECSPALSPWTHVSGNFPLLTSWDWVLQTLELPDCITFSQLHLKKAARGWSLMPCARTDLLCFSRAWNGLCLVPSSCAFYLAHWNKGGGCRQATANSQGQITAAQEGRVLLWVADSVTSV